ncbi:hypothetical protein OGAPHI_003785 [Ogataea philodendri]|uniref:37S ribosomal protein S22, mitochondrial n=1 Tax=Ogataea philodendri TaxID=1378263 RepID=A0A9P8P5I4_9ASCO|nr:uncharacterized protein OGAPHI_003785 [Ogataea philodendri]KAH3665597.1 hypothetical protein OGAPHI_003785 [Ogataea philodendri]
MLRTRAFALARRFGGCVPRRKIQIEHDDDKAFETIERARSVATEKSELFYAYRAGGETFGQLVNEVLHDRDPLMNRRVVTQEEALEGVDPKYRNTETGELYAAATSKDARLDPKTVAGRVNRTRIVLPDLISDAVNYNMLLLHEPKVLKAKVADHYIKLEEVGLQTRTSTEEEADVYIASSFLQNYATCYQVLDELKRRAGDDWMPKRVLDYGHGPGTGMLALNEIMGDQFDPEVKDVVVNGSFHMERRAKILLSRQLNEQYLRDDVEGVDQIDQIDQIDQTSQTKVDEKQPDVIPEVTRVKTKLLKIKSVILDKLRPEKVKYDLIIAQHQMLTDRANFPLQVDQSLDVLVNRLAPGGYLVIVERGNPLGAEIIARARQVMLRPEDHESKTSKVPRLYKNSAILTKEEAADIEPELLQNFEVQTTETVDPINLQVVAPCSHHGKCPLQFFNPDYYKMGQIGKRLKFCNYTVDVARPKYVMQLKRGAKLASSWQDTTRKQYLAYAGKGRPNGKDFETASYSYLIVQRSTESNETLEQLRSQDQGDRPVGYQTENPAEYPRVLSPPLKRKGFVVTDMCAPSGHVEKWYISKSVGNQAYHDARKLKMGDVWALESKSRALSTKENTFYFEKLKKKEEELRKQRKQDAKLRKKKMREDYEKALNSEPKTFGESLKMAAQLDSFRFMALKKQKDRLQADIDRDGMA